MIADERSYAACSGMDVLLHDVLRCIALISLRSLVSSLNEQQLSPQIFHIVIWRSTCRGCDSFVALGSRLPWPHHDSKLFEQDGDGTEKDPPGPRSESFWDQSELLVKIQDSVLGTSSMPPAKHDFMSEDRGEPRRLRKSDDEDIVRPRFWNEPSRKESISNLQKACEKMINHEAQLELLLQVELLPSSYCISSGHRRQVRASGPSLPAHLVSSTDQDTEMEPISTTRYGSMRCWVFCNQSGQDIFSNFRTHSHPGIPPMGRRFTPNGDDDPRKIPS